MAARQQFSCELKKPLLRFQGERSGESYSADESTAPDGGAQFQKQTSARRGAI